jgi:hypothetical protein
MTTYLVFETKDQADAAQAKIASNMGLGNDTTKAWAIPQQRVDKKWAFPKPDEDYMTDGKADEADYIADWFNVEGIE